MSRWLGQWPPDTSACRCRPLSENPRSSATHVNLSLRLSRTPMTSDPNRAQEKAAAFAMLKAEYALFPPTPIPKRSLGLAGNVQSVPASQAAVPHPMPPTPEALEAAREAALEAFPEDVRAAARL